MKSLMYFPNIGGHINGFVVIVAGTNGKYSILKENLIIRAALIAEIVLG